VIRWWIGLWDRREAATSLAVARILLALVVLWDLLDVVRLGLVVPLWGPADVGGMGNPAARLEPPLLYTWFPQTAETAQWTVGVAVVLALCLFVGVGTRFMALGLMLVLAQLALVLPAADRGIDMLLRNALLILGLSGAGGALSVDAWRRTGTIWGGDLQVPSWPRYLLVVQMTVLYFTAGVQKVSTEWLPIGAFSALYIAMRDPAFAVGELAWLDAAYPLTQVATAATLVWEWSAPLILLNFHFRDRAIASPGRFRRVVGHRLFLPIWLGIGAGFHLGTAATLRLGIFPFACLSLYPCFWHPNDFAAAIRKLLRRD
jgi:uncharacterized membrane protein YphA (DoxX/SURF4 family)